MAKQQGDGLSPKSREFCAQYVAMGRNATRAYMSVYPRASEKTAAVNGHRLLRNTNVAAEVDRLSKLVLKRAQATADEVLRELTRLAMVDPAQLVGPDGTMLALRDMPEEIRRCIASIEKDSDGNVKIKFWDKNTALTNLAKHHKLLTDKIEVSGQVSLADRIRKARMRAGRDLTANK